MRRVYYYCLVLISFCFTVQARTVAEQDSLALVALYNSTNGAGWTKTWNLNEPVNTWHGIMVDAARKRVKSVFLDNNNLVGTLPAALGNLKPELLVIRNNKITGSIPPELGNLTPADPGNPEVNKYLRFLYLSNNLLSGSIPKELFNNYALYEISLAGNKLTGPIPDRAYNLVLLDTLNFSHNQLSGPIPPSLLYTMKIAKYINLSANKLTGSLPTRYVNPSRDIDLDLSKVGDSLGTLSLRGNRLTDLPDLSGLKSKKLKTFEADFNHLSFAAIERNKTVLTKFSPQNGPGRTYHITGATITLRSTAAGSGNTYQWYKNSVKIAGATNASLVLSSLTDTDFGIYHCSVGNPSSAGVVLFNPIDTLLGRGSARDSLALVKLYESTGGAGWFRPWDLSKPYITWRGLGIKNGRVQSINLTQNRLTGTIPTELSNLDSLKFLHLSYNQLTGAIPSSFSDLSSLQILSLRNNQLTGAIPDLSKLTKLTALSLANNKLEGSLPTSIGSLVRLEYLYLFNNQLTGAIPTQIGSLVKLKYLFLFNNQLTGAIPTQIGSLTSLTELDLGDNKLTGAIPSTIGSLNSLTILDLATNQLSGAIPPEIGSLTKLQFLLLGNNKLDGAIPAQIGTLTELIDLDLYSNQLKGTIPTQISNLTKLRFLNLRSNQLSGTIPTQLATLTNLEWISLRSNLFTGTLPDLKNLTKLGFLWIYDNQLSILPNLSTLTKLTNFRVQNNRLGFGDISPNLARLGAAANYSPQIIRAGKSYTLGKGSALTLEVSVSGAGNVYQWYKNKVAIAGKTQATLGLTNIQAADTGYYHCQVTNSAVPNLILMSDPDTVRLNRSAPTAITLTKTEIPENSSVGTTIGTLSTTDPDAGDTHTYTIEGADAGNFKIAGNLLQNNAVFDFETKSSYTITIVSTDKSGLTFKKEFTITVTDVDENQPPTALPEVPTDDFANPLKLYPNPSSGLVKIDGLDKTQISKIEVVNSKGEVVQTYSKTQATYDLSNLAKGIYVILIQTDGETKRLQFVLN